MARMRAIRVEQPGGPEVLVPVTCERPALTPGQVLVRLRAIGVNFADIMCRNASHPGMPSPPLIPGCEGCGTVEACGAGVKDYKKGNRVAVYSPPGGTYAEWVAVPRDYVLPIPRQMSFLQGAAFTHVYLTAYHALRTSGRARRGDWVVVTAAAGGVGTAAIQLCQAWDLRVIAGVGSESKFQLLEKLGVQYHVNYRSQSLASYVKQITGGKGADLVLESVGGEVFREALDSLAAFGRIVLFGVASGEVPEVDCNRLLATSSVFAALNLSVFFATAPSLIQQSWNRLIELYCAGKLKPVIGSRFPLAQAAEAHRLMESRTSTGKILLDPET